MILGVPRKIFLGIRINPELRDDLEKIARSQERSVSQICELLLRTGTQGYKKEGPKYLERFLSRQKKEYPAD
jgi:hypothetical protein